MTSSIKITPEMNVLIKKTYKKHKKRDGSLVKLSRRLNVSPSWLSMYALKNGFKIQGTYARRWDDNECLILKTNARLADEVISKKLLKEGYKRSPISVKNKKYREKLHKNLFGMNLKQAAECLGKTDYFVQKMINDGKIKASRKGTKRTNKQGGDIWYILDCNLRKFIIKYIHLIEIKNIDKFWLIDLLTKK